MVRYRTKILTLTLNINTLGMLVTFVTNSKLENGGQSGGGGSRGIKRGLLPGFRPGCPCAFCGAKNNLKSYTIFNVFQTVKLFFNRPEKFQKVDLFGFRGERRVIALSWKMFVTNKIRSHGIFIEKKLI